MKDFDAYATSWWDPQGPLWTLHAIHRLRSQLFDVYGPWEQKDVLDVGCGGGLCAMDMVQRGAFVSAFDNSEALIEQAKKHDTHHAVDYRLGCCMDEAMYASEAYDAVLAFEVIEHVESPDKVLSHILRALRPGGLIMLSSPQRSACGYIFGILIPEYILSWLPVGTHRYHNLVSLNTVLHYLITQECEILDVRGMGYYPIRNMFDWSASTAIHYTVVARKKL